MPISDEQFKLLQTIFNASRMGHPCPSNVVVEAAPLMASGYVEMRGEVGSRGEAELIIPAEAQQELAAAGKYLRVR